MTGRPDGVMPSGAEPLSGVFVTPAMDKLSYGPGSLARLPAELDLIGAERVLLVTGATLAASDIAERVRTLLGARCAGVFEGCRQHVPRESVLAGATLARDLEVDGLVSLGGGSPIDTAKAVAMCLAMGVSSVADIDRLRLADEAAGVDLGGLVVPHVSVSTTLSGAEFTGVVGITDPVRGRKDLYASRSLAPKVAVLDAELSLATPGWLWAATGLRAIDHCVETICSIRRHPFADALCLRALEMLATALPTTAADPADLAARTASQVAMWMSVYALATVPLGLSHAIGHQLGARCGVPHGVCSALLLPEVMDFNRPATASRQRLVAQAFGLGVEGLTDEDIAASAARRLRVFVTELGIHNRLSDWGVTEDAFPEVATHTMQDFMITTNPVPVTDAQVVVDLLKAVG